MDTNQEKPNTTLEPKVQKADVVPELFEQVQFSYINSSQTQASNWDVRIVFSERLGSTKIEPRVGVVMSHQHAKAFHLALGGTISRLERMMGVPIQYTATNPKVAEEPDVEI